MGDVNNAQNSRFIALKKELIKSNKKACLNRDAFINKLVFIY